MEYTITLNKDYNSLEVSFIEKPANEIIEALKKLHFRWNRYKHIWYGFTDEETLKNAIENLEVSEPAPKNDTSLNDEEKAILNEYIELSANTWADPEHWTKYYKDNR